MLRQAGPRSLGYSPWHSFGATKRDSGGFGIDESDEIDVGFATWSWLGRDEDYVPHPTCG